MRFGIVILPQETWPVARERWRAAEELGFDNAWTYDHLSWRDLSGQPWGATIPLLTAAATVTERITLGTFVSNPNFRHPVPFAKELATLDDVSGGRTVLGVGSGSATAHDALVLGDPEYSPRERHERFEEFVALLDRLLRFERDGRGIDFEGTWYTARGARMVGSPAQEPRLPFAIAANGPRGLDLVARTGDAWITNGPGGTTDEEWWTAIDGLSRRLDEALLRHGRDPRSIERHLSVDSIGGARFPLHSVDEFEDAVGRADALGFTHLVVHWPRQEGVYAGPEAMLYEIASRFDRYR